jgi:peptidoglycan/LPS O-acetylase OafA/YrhL
MSLIRTGGDLGSASPETQSPPSAALPRRASSFRPDIEGLRAIAVGSVLLYHARLAWVPGGFVGVDVFFVISGFLITSLMVREVGRNGRLHLADFWARRARRLLPASTLVLLFSALVTVLWLPVTSRKVFGGDIVAAAGYVVNWRLGYREVDYLAEDIGASPVQHYWSLAVEEQFYVVWPLLIALVVAVTAVAHRRRVLFATILALTAASFGFAVYYSVAQPGLAFFVSTTRLWELGVGALLAVGWPLVTRVPPPARAAVGWLGVAAVLYAALRFDSAMIWPGTATLVPVLGTAAAIAAGGDGMTAHRGVGRLLGLSPMVWLGGLSYSLYLWHWPLLIAAEGAWGHLQVRYMLLVVLASVVPAWLSLRLVENPVRQSPRVATARPALLLGACTTALAALAGVAVIASFALVDTTDVASSSDAPGAAALTDPRFSDIDWTTVDKVDAIRPSPLNPDTPDIYDTRACMPLPLQDRYEACEFGDVTSDHTVVLVGDSKAAQWFTPVENIAKRNGWRMLFIGKDGCQFANVIRPAESGQANPACSRWSQWALQKILAEKPDVVLTTTRAGDALRPDQPIDADMTQQAMVDGLVSHWRAVTDSGAVLVSILDTPGRPGGGVPECVQENQHHLTACRYPLADRLTATGQPAQRAAAAQVPEAHLVDMTDVVCPGGEYCPAVIGNVLVYRTGTHLTDSYAASSTGILAARLDKATDGLLGPGD